jgi:hypothetical protein
MALLKGLENAYIFLGVLFFTVYGLMVLTMIKSSKSFL